jgi:hypothetical protein
VTKARQWWWHLNFLKSTLWDSAWLTLPSKVLRRCTTLPNSPSSWENSSVSEARKWVTRLAQPYVHTHSVCPFLSFTHYLFLLEEDRSQEDSYGTDVVITLLVISSHSWIISYDLKWYKTSVVFTTVFHSSRALLSCRRQWSWIVSSVWILAPWLWLRCWLRDIHSSSISIPA